MITEIHYLLIRNGKYLSAGADTPEYAAEHWREAVWFKSIEDARKLKTDNVDLIRLEARRLLIAQPKKEG